MTPVIPAESTWEAVERAESEAYLPPTVGQRLAFTALVADLTAASPIGVAPADTCQRAEALGFRCTSLASVVVLADEGRGAGLYAFRLGPLPSSLVVEAPHARSDLHTGRIASSWFDDGQVRMLAVATAHRDLHDPAHEPTSWFQAATAGALHGLDAPLVFQLHGFGSGHTEAPMVLSDGAAPLAPGVLGQFGDRVAQALGLATWATGNEVPALAAERNVQGRLVGAGATFLHAELALHVREALRTDRAARSRLEAALSGDGVWR